MTKSIPVRVSISPKYVEGLHFILSEFINTHEQSPDTYKKELEIAEKLKRKLEPNL